MNPAGGFTKMDDAVLARRDLLPSNKLVLAVILDAKASIGVARIMRRTGLSRAAVLRSIRRLEDADLLFVDRGRPGQRNKYRLPRADETGIKTRPVSDGQSGIKTRPVHQMRPVLKRDQSAIKTRPEAVLKRDHVQTRPLSDYAARAARGGNRTSSGRDQQTLIHHFTERWAERFGAAYPFDRSKDPPAAKRLLEVLSGDLERAMRVVDAYLGDTDEWIAGRGHRLSILASNAQLPRYLSATAPTPRDTPSATSEHPLIEAGRAKWPGAVEADPDWWVSLAHRAENPRSDLNLQRLKRSIVQAESFEAFKAAVSGKEVASASA